MGRKATATKTAVALVLGPQEVRKSVRILTRKDKLHDDDEDHDDDDDGDIENNNTNTTNNNNGDRTGHGDNSLESNHSPGKRQLQKPRIKIKSRSNPPQANENNAALASRWSIFFPFFWFGLVCRVMELHLCFGRDAMPCGPFYVLVLPVPWLLALCFICFILFVLSQPSRWLLTTGIVSTARPEDGSEVDSILSVGCDEQL